MVKDKLAIKRAVVMNVAIALLLFSTMFLTFRIFVEAEIISKWYVFIGGGLLYGLISLSMSKMLILNSMQ